MKVTRFFLLASVMLATALSAGAQKTSGHGYGYFGVGGAADSDTAILSAGAGGEGFLYRGLAAGAELGYAFPSGCGSCGVGLLSLNPAYHFTSRQRSQKLVPFVTAGYSLVFRSGSANLYNWAGGITYWFKESLGLRFEVRDYRFHEGHFYTAFRVAFAFR